MLGNKCAMPKVPSLICQILAPELSDIYKDWVRHEYIQRHPPKITLELLTLLPTSSII